MFAAQHTSSFTPARSAGVYKLPVASTLAIEGLRLTESNLRVTARGIPLLLRPIEFRLLQFFMSHPEHVHSRTVILQQVWGKKVLVGERTIDVHIRRLRVVLQPFGMDGWVKTHPTRGYSFSTAN